MRQPRVWIPVAASAAVIALSVGLIVAQASGDTGARAADVPSASPTPSVTPTATAALPVGGGSATPAPSPSASVSASPEPEASPGGDPDEAAAAQAAADRAASACVPGAPLPAPAVATSQVLPGDPAATTTDITPKATQMYSGYTQLGFSADGARLLTIESGEGRYTIRLLDSRTMVSVLDLESSPSGQPPAQAAWDRTRTRVAVARGLADDSLEVSIVDARTAEQAVVATLPGATAESIAWSADGGCLALAVRGRGAWDIENDPSVHTITVVRLSDGAVTVLGSGASPLWSADGSLAFWRVDSGRAKLWRSTADGAEQSQLGSGAGRWWTTSARVSPPIASSDATRIAYVDGSAPVKVRVAEQDGTNDRALAQLDLNWAEVQWMPGERELLVRGGKKLSSTVGLWTVDVATGRVTALAVPRAAGEILGASTPLPDGSGVLATVGIPRAAELNTMRIVLIRNGVATRLGDEFYGSPASAPAWSLDGDTLAVSASTALSLPRDVLGHLLVTSR